MRYALIGCGRISTNHIKAALENKLTIAAVSDIVPERMEQLLSKHDMLESNVLRYTDYSELLEREKPELVAIATESGNHAAIALACIAKGVNVIIEKPIALSLDDADLIIATAEEKGVLVCACHQNRFNLAVRQLRRALEDGRFGRLSHGSVHVRWNRNKDYYDQAPWRGTWANDGGCLMNQSIHGIDLLRWIMGDSIEEVCAYTAQRFHTYLECEDIGLAVVRFKNGALASIEGTVNVYPRNLEETLYLFGENGTVKLGGKSCNAIETWEFSQNIEIDNTHLVEETSNVYGNGHTPLYEDMISAIKEGRPPMVDAHAGRRALELVLAIYKSSYDGRPVRLPLNGVSTSDFVKE